MDRESHRRTRIKYLAKMKYERTFELSQSELLDGVRALFQNAQNHFNNSKTAGDSAQYGLGVALAVLSIEELIKANALFLVLLDACGEDLFKAAFDSKNLHRTRLKVAEGLSISHGLIDKHGIIKSIEEAAKTLDFDFSKLTPLEILKMDWMPAFMQKFHESPEMKAQIDKLVQKVVPEVEAKISQQTSWFFNAQSKKEKGMYGDLINGEWHSPSNVSKDDFIEANSNSSFLFANIGKPIETLVSASPLFQGAFITLAKESIKHASGHVK